MAYVAQTAAEVRVLRHRARRDGRECLREGGRRLRRLHLRLPHQIVALVLLHVLDHFCRAGGEVKSKKKKTHIATHGQGEADRSATSRVANPAS